MKKYFLIAIATLFLGSCLDENPRDRLNEEEVLNASNLYQNTIGSLYNYIGGNADSQGLQGTARGVYDICTFTTDEAMLPTRGGDWYDGGLWMALHTHLFLPSLQPFEGTWNYLYKVIVNCNQAIEDINRFYAFDSMASPRTKYVAEARAIRAMYYYYLLDLFGNVPMVVTTDISMDNATQMSRSLLFNSIYVELEELLPLLEETRSNVRGEYYGRVTRPVAWFLLAKMALNAEIWLDDDPTDNLHPIGSDTLLDCEGTKLNAWEACLYWCDKLTKFGYRLESDYASNFIVYNENSQENIFTIPLDKDLYTNTFKNLFRSRHYNHGIALGMDAENGTCATVSTVLTYGYGTDQLDNRYNINFYSDTLRVDGKIVYLDNGEPLVYMPLEVKLDLTGSPYEKTAGARMSKYEIDRTAYSDGLLQDNDIVLFRYADILLMKSEAKVRNGQNGDAELNAVRSRVGMGPRTATLDNLLDERLMELAWEGWRRQDLIRFGRYHEITKNTIIDESDAHTTLFPIPGRALSLNSNLEQNPGY